MDAIKLELFGNYEDRIVSFRLGQELINTCVGNVSAFSKLEVLKNANMTLNAIFIRFW